MLVKYDVCEKILVSEKDNGLNWPNHPSKTSVVVADSSVWFLSTADLKRFLLLIAMYSVSDMKMLLAIIIIQPTLSNVKYIYIYSII